MRSLIASMGVRDRASCTSIRLRATICWSIESIRKQTLIYGAAIGAVAGWTSVASAAPLTSSTPESTLGLLEWVTYASLVLSPIILIALGIQGAWKLPPSPRLPAWRVPLEVGFLAFATSTLLGGIGHWYFASSTAQGGNTEEALLQTTAMATLGGYLGAAFPLAVMGVVWTQLPRPVGGERPLPRAGALIFGAIALVIGLPLIEAVSFLGNQFQQIIQDIEADPIAHETLEQLYSSPRDVWWWIIALGAVLATPIIEETLYRGILQQSLRRLGIGRWWAILFTTGLFVLMHIPALNMDSMIGSISALFAAGVLFGWIREQTGRLDAPIIAHMLFNAFNLALAMLIAG